MKLACRQGLESKPVFGPGFLESGLDTPILIRRKLNPLRSTSSNFMRGSLQSFYCPPHMPRDVQRLTSLREVRLPPGSPRGLQRKYRHLESPPLPEAMAYRHSPVEG